ncbi:hypothetical protein EVAR_24048_1 [Eumeta japonica]|uniref:Uncharacterized protein n=1 Tax=Eumeta variegata TaxID=151549 RepID=A0A4C1VRG7_EUMVA|nr:hypothetical protein EVAR_24048_1 [Eumeta japonica]
MSVHRVFIFYDSKAHPHGGCYQRLWLSLLYKWEERKERQSYRKTCLGRHDRSPVDFQSRKDDLESSKCKPSFAQQDSTTFQFWWALARRLRATPRYDQFTIESGTDLSESVIGTSISNQKVIHSMLFIGELKNEFLTRVKLNSCRDRRLNMLNVLSEAFRDVVTASVTVVVIKKPSVSARPTGKA